MPKVSTKEDKNIYQLVREEQGLSREKASECLEWINVDKIVRIEGDDYIPKPDEVVAMARGYNHPELCNHYCSKQCPIGQEFVPEIKMNDLSQIVLEMMKSLYDTVEDQKRIVEITIDGKISNDELDDFIDIQEQLEKLTMATEALRLWVEKVKDTEGIDLEEYRRRRELRAK